MTIHLRPAALLGVGLVSLSAAAEIRDVLKSAEIETQLARTTRDQALHERPNYAIWLKVHSGKPGPPESHPDADDVLWIRRGSGTVTLGERGHAVGAGDVIFIERNVRHQIDPGAGRLEYVVVRVFPTGENLPPRAGFLAPRRMPDLLKKSEIDANQPLHSGRNFTMNYVIYSGRSGPYEAHRGCVDIYLLQVGTGVAHLGGQIVSPTEESPGEIRGTEVTGSRTYNIGPGDLVVIPRHGVHHMKPAAPKLGYLLVKVWAE